MIDDEELRRYSKEWRRPAVAKDLERYEEQEPEADRVPRVLFEPRGVQIEALYALRASRAEGVEDGYVLGLREEFKGVVTDETFAEQMGDVIRYRVMEYYRRRYVGE